MCLIVTRGLEIIQQALTTADDPNEKELDLVSKYLIQSKGVDVPFIPGEEVEETNQQTQSLQHSIQR